MREALALGSLDRGQPSSPNGLRPLGEARQHFVRVEVIGHGRSVGMRRRVAANPPPARLTRLLEAPEAVDWTAIQKGDAPSKPGSRASCGPTAKEST